MPAPQIRMHHLPLDRPGPHNRHLDHQIVKRPRLQSRQHRHLRPALDLKHADRVGPADHVVHGLVVLRDRGQRQLAAVSVAHEVKALANRGEHPKAEAIDLQNAEFVEVVFVPLDDRAALHRGVLDRHQLAQAAPAVITIPPTCCDKMPREANDFVHAVHEPPAEVGRRIDAAISHPQRENSACGRTLRRASPTRRRGRATGLAPCRRRGLAERPQYVITVAAIPARSRPYLSYIYCNTSSRRSCSKSTSMSGASFRSRLTNRSNNRSLFSGSTDVTPEHVSRQPNWRPIPGPGIKYSASGRNARDPRRSEKTIHNEVRQ